MNGLETKRLNYFRKEESFKDESCNEGIGKEDKSRWVSYKAISFDPDNLTQIISEFRTLRKEITESPKTGEFTLSEFLEWRGKILPFLAARPQEGRTLLYSYPFILAFTQPKQRHTREICKIVILNVIDHEFTARLREIGEQEEKRP